MKRVLTLITALFFAFMACPAALPAADAYPSKPVTGMVPMAAGGSSDLLARAIEKVWTKYAPKPLVIINKPGGGGVVGTEGVVRSKPDGYTLYIGYGSGHDVVMPSLQKMPYDPVKDLIAVARVSIHSIVIVTGAKSPLQFHQGRGQLVKEGRKTRYHSGIREGGLRGSGPDGLRQGGRRQYRHGSLLGRRRGHNSPGGRPSQ